MSYLRSYLMWYKIICYTFICDFQEIAKLFNLGYLGKTKWWDGREFNQISSKLLNIIKMTKYTVRSHVLLSCEAIFHKIPYPREPILAGKVIFVVSPIDSESKFIIWSNQWFFDPREWKLVETSFNEEPIADLNAWGLDI